MQFLGNPEKKVIRVEIGLDALRQRSSADDGRHLAVGDSHIEQLQSEDKHKDKELLKKRLFGHSNSDDMTGVQPSTCSQLPHTPTATATFLVSERNKT